MEKFKLNLYGIDLVIDSKFPKKLVDDVQTTLNNLGGDLIATPMMIDPNNMSLVFGVIEDKKLQYRITISAAE